MFGLFKSRNKFKAEEFSVEIKRTFRECVEVTYAEKTKSFLFTGEFVGTKWEQINLGVPASLPEYDRPRAIANLVEALEQLSLEFVIYELDPAEPVPQSERQ